ncbi:MAG: hypothetical protein IIA87_03410 [Nanoarchaeota archaeon]|nr:hypothetical protein [Nanoarchaeota archaeon]
MVTKQELIDFEKWTVATFNDGKLKSPVHLSGSIDGNLEHYLISYFKQIKKTDWVATTYRSHYHALLKGVPPEKLKKWILDNKSIHFMDKKYKMFSSAIVGGTLSIALGIAISLKMRKSTDKVYCFIGDMTNMSGTFHEVFKYSINHKLPIKFLVECNYLSTDTPTSEVWGITDELLEKHYQTMNWKYPDYFDYVIYKRKYPHYGTGKFISKLWEDTDETKGKGF